MMRVHGKVSYKKENNLIYGLGLIRMVKYSDPTHGFFYTRT